MTALRRSLRARLRGIGSPRPADAASGAVTGLFSIPEGMAYAAIAGFNPVAGLYAGVVPAIVGSLTSRTVLMVTTLTSAIALTSQNVLSDAGLDPKEAGNVAVLTVVVGAVMLLMGVLRLGVVMSFVSNAVMTGFATGIALQIIVGVLKDATGYKPQGHNKLYQLGTGSRTSATGRAPRPSSPLSPSPCGRWPARSSGSKPSLC